MSDKPRQIRVRGLRRDKVDVAKLGQALLDLAEAQREKEAQAEHQRQHRAKGARTPRRHPGLRERSGEPPEAA